MIEKLKRLAQKSPRLQRHASIFLKGGAVVATGHNTEERHAEIVALYKLWPDKRVGTTVFNLRLKPSGAIGGARPCSECRMILWAYGVKDIFYTTNAGGMERMRL